MNQLTDKEKKDIEKFKASNLPQFKLETFEGPLDLLLYLLKKDKLDIYDIPIAEITKQYMRLITSQNLKNVDLDLVGEYLFMAAELTQIKSKMLIPKDTQHDKDEEDEFEKDPRAELVKKLLEYQRFKEAAGDLALAPKFNEDTFKPGYKHASIDIEDLGESSINADDIDAFTLISCLSELISQVPNEIPHEVEDDETTISEKMVGIVDLLCSLKDDNSQIPFKSLFSLTSKSEIIITFLSILELNRLNYIKIFQPIYGGEIWVRKNFDPESINIEELSSIKINYSNNIENKEGSLNEE